MFRTMVHIVVAVFSAFAVAHGAECDGDCPSTAAGESKQTEGSVLMQTASSPTMGITMQTWDPFEDLEDGFDTSVPRHPTSKVPMPSLDIFSGTDFWSRCVRDAVIITILFALVPLAAGTLIVARSHIAKKQGQERALSNVLGPPQHLASSINFLPLMEAARSGDVARWRLLLKTIPNVGRVTDRFGSTALHVAANAPCAEMGAVLIKDHHADVNAKDTWDETPLHFAARRGSVEVCELLVANGADVNSKTDDATPLLEAAKAGNESTCKFLLDHGASCGDALESDLPPMLTSLLLVEMATPRSSSQAAAEELDE